MVHLLSHKILHGKQLITAGHMSTTHIYSMYVCMYVCRIQAVLEAVIDFMNEASSSDECVSIDIYKTGCVIILTIYNEGEMVPSHTFLLDL